MSDMRIQYEEEMVGADHPTKADTLNRLALVEAGPDGKGLYRYLKQSDQDPETASDEVVIFAKQMGGSLTPCLRRPDNGEVVTLGGGVEIVEQGLSTLTWSGPSGGYYTAETLLNEAVDLESHDLWLPASAGQLGSGYGLHAWLEADRIQWRTIHQNGTTKAAWSVVRVLGLAAPIQRGVSAGSLPAGDQTWDITLDALPDPARALPLLHHSGYLLWYAGASLTRALAQVTSATNLRVEALISGGTASGQLSWSVWPF